jgi:predicted lipid-binding transport protein (Tim44 family)
MVTNNVQELRMRFPLAIVLAVLLAFAPGLADARPGLGGSMGSRGSHSWSAPPSTAGAPYGASPFSRSMTPNTYNTYGSSYGGGYSRPMFGRGMLGGLLGAGLFGMLLGGGFFGFHGGFGFMGLLIQLFLLYLLARWVMTRFLGMPAMAGPGGFARNMFPPRPMGASGGGLAGGMAAAARRGQALALTSGDYQMFSQLLTGIQAAWSANDLNGLRAMTTPEMLSYFAEQLAELNSRGQHNKVTEVRLQHGDLSEAWAEGRVQYATVSMKFSMIDVTYDRANRVVDGSPTERVTVTEFWTFMRSQGGHWILSAIQQAR